MVDSVCQMNLLPTWQTALYESLLRRETVSRTLSELRRRCLVEFVTTGSLHLADLRGLAETYPAT